MAEVTHRMGLFQQLLLVMRVRWLTFRNGLRSQSEKMHFVGTVAISIVFTLMALGVGFGIGFGSFELASSNQLSFLSLILWGIFFFWQFLPVMVAQSGAGFDGRNLLRFPLRFSAFLLMSVAYGISDPFALAGIFWHILMFVGVTAARPDLAGWAALALATSVLMNLFFNRMLASWVERFLAKRRTREILTAIFIFLIVCVQFTGIIAQKWGPQLRHVIEATSAVWHSLPPGLPGFALEQAAKGNASGAFLTTGMLALYAAAFCALFAVRAHAQFAGEDLGESAAPTPRKPAALKRPALASTRAPGVVLSQTRFPGLVNSPVFSIFIKEIRYFYRNSMMFFNLFLPLLLIVIFSVSSSTTGRHGGASPFGSAMGSTFIYPGAVAYFVMLIMQQFSPNCMGYEGRGIERLFLAPVSFRNVMIGKNLFHGTLLALEALLVLALITALGHQPRVIVVLATWAALPFSAFVHFAVGNWLSLQYPRRFEFGVRRQRPSGMTLAINLGLNIAVMAVIAMVGAITLWLAGLWFLPVVFAALSAAGFVVYRAALDDVSRRALAQREVLIEQLAR